MIRHESQSQRIRWQILPWKMGQHHDPIFGLTCLDVGPRICASDLAAKIATRDTDPREWRLLSCLT